MENPISDMFEGENSSLMRSFKESLEFSSKVLFDPKKVRTSERSELIKFFVENLKDKKGKQYKPARIAMLLSHLKVKDLYVFKSMCKDRLDRNGEVAMNKYFWFSLRPLVVGENKVNKKI